MNYASLLAALLAVCVSGCTSLNNAGTASYRFSQYTDDKGQTHTEVVLNNGKEIGVVDATFVVAADGSKKIHLHEEGVRAFEGQRIASGTAKTAATSAVKAVAIGGLTVAAPLLAPAAGAALASPGLGAAAAGAGALAIGQELAK